MAKHLLYFNVCNSAGVGRTGTFIVIDIELQRAHIEHAVDPYGTVMKLRENRSNMVQTEVNVKSITNCGELTDDTFQTVVLVWDTQINFI